jgi:hypothetical protein
MSATLFFFLVPLGAAAVVWSLCFVGCTYPTFTFSSPYSDTILDPGSNPNLIAYWPLSDLIGNPACPISL